MGKMTPGAYCDYKKTPRKEVDDRSFRWRHIGSGEGQTKAGTKRKYVWGLFACRKRFYDASKNSCRRSADGSSNMRLHVLRVKLDKGKRCKAGGVRVSVGKKG